MDWSPDEVLAIALCMFIVGLLLGATIAVNAYESK